MIIYFIVLFLILVLPCSEGNIKDKSKDKRKLVIHKSQLYVAFIFILIVSLTGLRKYTVGFDLQHHYLSNFYKYNSESWYEIKSYGIECGLFVLAKVIGLFTSNSQAFIAITSTIPVFLTVRFFYRYSDDFKLSIILFYTYCLAFQYMNQIAQTIAVSFVLLAYDFLRTKNRLGFILCIAIATTFHTTALFCVALWLIYKMKITKKTIIWFSIATVAFSAAYTYIFEIGASLLPQYEWYLGSARHGVGDSGLGVFVRITILGIVVAWSIIELRFTKAIHDPDADFKIYMCYLAFLFQIMTTKMIVMNRMGYYELPFVCIMVPSCIKALKANKRLIKLTVVLLMIMYFSYITIKWGSISYGVVPYEFFWR